MASIFDSNLVLLRYAVSILRQILLQPLVILELVVVDHVPEQGGVLVATQEVALGDIPLVLVFLLRPLVLLLVLGLWIVLSNMFIMLLIFLICEQNCRTVKLRQVVFVPALVQVGLRDRLHP